MSIAVRASLQVSPMPTCLHPECCFDNFPEFSWVVEKIEELLLRIGRVFQQDPEMFRLLVYMPKLKEGDTTPDPQTWCNGFVEGVKSWGSTIELLWSAAILY
jgi:hypothetical protein